MQKGDWECGSLKEWERGREGEGDRGRGSKGERETGREGERGDGGERDSGMLLCWRTSVGNKEGKGDDDWRSGWESVTCAIGMCAHPALTSCAGYRAEPAYIHLQHTQRGGELIPAVWISPIVANIEVPPGAHEAYHGEPPSSPP